MTYVIDTHTGDFVEFTKGDRGEIILTYPKQYNLDYLIVTEEPTKIIEQLKHKKGKNGIQKRDTK